MTTERRVATSAMVAWALAGLLASVSAHAGRVGTVADKDPAPPFEPSATTHPLQGLDELLNGPDGLRQPSWKRVLVRLALNRKPRYAAITAFCPNCGGPGTRWGTKTRPGIAAADPAHWGPGSVVWIGPPVSQIVVVEDTGGSIRGRDRFDVCVSLDCRVCTKIGGRSRVVYVPLHTEKPRSGWGRRPGSWQPPVPFDPLPILPRVPASG